MIATSAKCSYLQQIIQTNKNTCFSCLFKLYVFLNKPSILYVSAKIIVIIILIINRMDSLAIRCGFICRQCNLLMFVLLLSVILFAISVLLFRVFVSFNGSNEGYRFVKITIQRRIGALNSLLVRLVLFFSTLVLRIFFCSSLFFINIIANFLKVTLCRCIPLITSYWRVFSLFFVSETRPRIFYEDKLVALQQLVKLQLSLRLFYNKKLNEIRYSSFYYKTWKRLFFLCFRWSSCWLSLQHFISRALCVIFSLVFEKRFSKKICYLYEAQKVQYFSYFYLF